ncbi:hypothetical protein OPQ81_010479 [Rhizoctonia solani]|nr:hypothetical protein OPQ81_010479 [Rhizoctonia solani]
MPSNSRWRTVVVGVLLLGYNYCYSILNNNSTVHQVPIGNLGASRSGVMPRIPDFENQQQLSRDQANVVNNCWSEGSYELGVEALNAFRKGEGRYPSPSHIRHLLALALYPPGKITQPLQKNKSPSTPPSKLSDKSRPLAAPASLSPPLELLLTLAATTHPAHLTAGKIDTFKSPLAKESVRVGRARDCWTMVRDGFLSSEDGASTAQAKWMEIDDSDPSDGDDKPDSYVAPYAWRIVEWWIKLFEVDQAINMAESGSASHSTLLLSHIPPASRPGAPQNDIQTVVGVAFSALMFDTELCEINKLGLRLLTLLVNASATHAISPGTLVRVAVDQLPNLSSSAFKTLVAHFTGPVQDQPNSSCFPVYLYPRFCFCLAACYLSKTGSDVSDIGIFGGITDGSAGRRPKARPTARAPGTTDGQTSDVVQKQHLELYPAPSLHATLALLRSTPRLEGIKPESFSHTILLYALSRLAMIIGFEKQSAGQIESTWIPDGDLPSWRAGIATSVRLGFEADAQVGAASMVDSKRPELSLKKQHMAAATTMSLPPSTGVSAAPAPISSRKTTRPIARVSLASLTPNNLGTLRKLNAVLFPIRYSEKFYREVLEPELDEFCKLIYYNDIPVGAVCSRIERGQRPGEACVYIMTMGVLAPYRGLGLGSMALKQVFKAAAKYNEAIGDKPPIGTPPQPSTISTFISLNRKITSFYLHVHVPNADARAFYERFGFVERERIAGYYRKLGSSDGPERDAWVLERPVTNETNGTSDGN